MPDNNEGKPAAGAAPAAPAHGETLLGGAVNDQEAVNAAMAGMSAEDKTAYEALTPEAKEAKHKEFIAAKRKPAEPDPAKKAADEAAAAAAKAEAGKAALKAVVDAMTPEEKAAYEALPPEQKAAKDKEILDAKAAADGKKGAPEKYADFKLPEGMTLDKAVAEQFTALAKEFNLPQEAAQKLVDLQVTMQQKQGTAYVDGYKAQVTAWEEESRKELGAEPEKKLALAAKAANVFAPKELKEMLVSTGLGNNIHVLKMFIAIGEKMAEDKFVEGKLGAGGKEKNRAEMLYGDTMGKK
jgi:hypothetical protein